MKTIRASLFLAVLSGMKHAMSGAVPYAVMLFGGLVYPLQTYLCSRQVHELLRAEGRR